jgi:hypothetical protein
MRAHKYLTIVFLSVLLNTSARAQMSEWLDPFSPGLRKFLTTHPEDFRTLTNIAYEAFTNRTVRFYYFYTQNESVPWADHFYPNDNEVWMHIKADQPPADEFLLIIFESLNSKGEKRFEELWSQARSGNISKTNFALEITRQEFVATKRTRDLLGELKFSKKEISSSHYYKNFSGCPDSFDDYLAYLKELKSTAIKNYEAQYDLIRNQGSITNGPPP